jgi:micrococcal nuclease
MSRRLFLSLIALFALTIEVVVTSAAAPRVEPRLPGVVLRVIDGDTLDVRIATGLIRVRLHGVDAPERDQPGGEAALQWLRQHVQDREVLLEPISQDRYARMVAIVHFGDETLNRALVEAGNAWAYRRYLRRADRELCALEAAARTSGRGLWAQVGAAPPWEYRATHGQGPFTGHSRDSARDCIRDAGRKQPP